MENGVPPQQLAARAMHVYVLVRVCGSFKSSLLQVDERFDAESSAYKY